MLNQIETAGKIGIRAYTINSTETINQIAQECAGMVKTALDEQSRAGETAQKLRRLRVICARRCDKSGHKRWVSC